MGELGDTTAVPALLHLLGREERELQAALVLAVERFGRAALQPLIEALAHEDSPVREQAASILGVLGERDAVPALAKAMRDAHWPVRFACVQAIGTIGGPEAMQAMESMREDSDSRVRDIASRMINRAIASARS